VHAVRLVHPDSIEARVLEHIRERRSISEAEVSRWVFQGDLTPPQSTWSPQSDAVPIAAAEARRLAQARTMRSARGAAERCVTTRTSATIAFAAVHRITFANALGNVVAECACAHGVECASAGNLDRAVAQFAGGRCADIESQLAPLRAAVAGRVAKIRSRIASERSGGIQRSLFDARAETAAQHADLVTARLLDALARRAASVVSPVIAERAVATLMAAWPRHR
jgi:hypothetical protein